MVVRITIPDPDRRLIRRRHHPVDHRRKNNRCQAYTQYLSEHSR